jgi:hypothetical protein
MAALLLLGIALAPAAAQVRRALPRPTVAAPTAGTPATAPAPAPTATVQRQPTAATPAATPVGGGVAQVSADAVCASNNTPRVNNVNGQQSGIVYRPGSSLTIAGCGFGAAGQVYAYLSGGGALVPLIIDSWQDAKVIAHVDAALKGVLDIESVKVNIKPAASPVIGSVESTGRFEASRQTYRVTKNIPRYVKLVASYNTTTLGGWGQPAGGGPVAIENDGSVRRLTTGLVERADATDALLPLDPGKGFKVTDLHVEWLTIQRNNGETNVLTHRVVMFRGMNQLAPRSGGGWNVLAGDAFLQDETDPKLPRACFTATAPIRNCIYSHYQVSVDVTGPVGVTPP